MSYLQDLYQEVILDHNKSPRNFGKIEQDCFHSDGHNPLCGDKVTVYVRLKDGVVDEVSFEGKGCAISTASASLMTECVKGKPIAEVQAMFEKFHSLVTGENDLDEDGLELGKLEVLAGVKEFPMRVKCATLSWHTLNAAMNASEEVITTE